MSVRYFVSLFKKIVHAARCQSFSHNVYYSESTLYYVEFNYTHSSLNNHGSLSKIAIYLMECIYSKLDICITMRIQSDSSTFI